MKTGGRMVKSSLDGMNSQIKSEMLHRDGIIEIVVSLYLIIVGLSLFYHLRPFPMVFVPLIPVIIRSLRRRITWPRLGYAHIKTKGRSFMLLFIAVALIIGLMSYLFSRNSDPVTQNLVLSVFSGTILLIVFGFMIYRAIEERSRIYIFLGLLILSVCGVMYFDVPKTHLGSGLIVVSLPCLGYGIVKMYRFMKKYPVIKDAD